MMKGPPGASRLLKKSVLDFSNVACEKNVFFAALPQIIRHGKHTKLCMISPGHPWPGLSRGLKEFFRTLLVIDDRHALSAT